MGEYITVKEMAEIWDLTPRRVQLLCSEGKIDGAIRFGHSWAVPRGARRPDDHRTRQFRTYAIEED